MHQCYAGMKCPKGNGFGQVPGRMYESGLDMVSDMGHDSDILFVHTRNPTMSASTSGRVFAYCRVSTTDQTTDNQAREIAAAGFAIQPRRTVSETISGSVAAAQRRGFAKLIDRMEAGDVLVVTKLDRLGRNAMDVRSTVESLAANGIRVHCLALGGVDLTSAAGKMTMQVLGAVAEFERDLLIERTQAGISRARAEGKAFGRPSALSTAQQQRAIGMLAKGAAVAQIARDLGTSRQAIMRLREKAEA